MDNLLRMRILLGVFLILGGYSLQAQIPVTTGAFNYMPGLRYAPRSDSGLSNDYNGSYLTKQWSLVKYGGISTSFVFFKGGNATILSAPVGLQLNRRLNNNLYAFGGILAAPAYVNFQSFSAATGGHKYHQGNNFSGINSLGISSRVEMGLMYINDQKTFSISGSIGVERNSYPVYPFIRHDRVPRGSFKQ